MIEPARKCQDNGIFKQNYSLKLLITFKMAYSWCFSLGGNLDFPDFLQKKFYIIDCWKENSLLYFDWLDNMYQPIRMLKTSVA